MNILKSIFGKEIYESKCNRWVRRIPMIFSIINAEHYEKYVPLLSIQLLWKIRIIILLLY